MLFHENILETIGDTPLVRLNKVISTVFAQTQIQMKLRETQYLPILRL